MAHFTNSPEPDERNCPKKSFSIQTWGKYVPAPDYKKKSGYIIRYIFHLWSRSQQNRYRFSFYCLRDLLQQYIQGLAAKYRERCSHVDGAKHPAQLQCLITDKILHQMRDPSSQSAETVIVTKGENNSYNNGKNVIDDIGTCS